MRGNVCLRGRGKSRPGRDRDPGRASVCSHLDVEAVLAVVADRVEKRRDRRRFVPERLYREALLEIFDDGDPVLGGVPPEAFGDLYEALIGYRLTMDGGRARFEPDPGRRRRSGAFFTPGSIAEYAVTETLRPFLSRRPEPERLRILDPAVGGGAFLIAAGRLLGGRIEGLVGIDRDPGAVAAARATMRRAFPEAGSPTLLTGDPLLDEPEPTGPGAGGSPLGPERFDAVIGNPPYLNVKRGALSPHRDRLRKRFRNARGQFDAWALFLELALAWLKPGGRLGLVLPRPFLAAESYEGIRRALLTETDLERVAEFGLAFPGASVEAMVAVARKRGRPGSRPRPLRFVDATVHPRQTRPGPPARAFLSLPGAAIVPACGATEMAFLARMRRAPARLGDLVRVTRGLECGKRHPAVNDTPGRGRRPLLTGASVDAFLLESDLYLDPNRLSPEKHKPEALFNRRPKTVVRRVTDGLKAAVDERGALALNTLYILTPHEPAPPAFHYAMCALLNSTPLRRYHRLAHASDDRLFPYVRASQLKALPWPAPAVLAGPEGARLADLARRAQARPSRLDQPSIDALANRLFDVD
jgi:hypothetical protein